MTELSDIPVEILAAELLRRTQAASTREQQTALSGAMTLLAETIMVMQGYEEVYSDQLPLHQISPRLLVIELNRYLGRNDLRDDYEAFEELFANAGHLVWLIEASAARRWFNSAETLGAVLGKPPHGVLGLCRRRRSTAAQLLAIACGRLESLTPELKDAHITVHNRTAAHELTWWLQIARGLVTVAEYASAVMVDGLFEQIDKNVDRLERVLVAARAIVQSWDESSGVEAWGFVDPEALLIEDLFTALRERLLEARRQAEALGRVR